MSAARSIPGPSRLSRILVDLKSGPRLELEKLRGLKLILAAKNDHFGARHFIKEQLPRIQYVNPDLQIEVTKVPKSKSDVWKPEMLLEFHDGSTKTLDLHAKWSTTIVKELMETAGGESWARWKAEANASGSPLVPGEELQKTPEDFVS